MDESKLAEVGRSFLGVVRRRWPEFAGSCSVDEFGSLIIEHPSPDREHGTCLWISADAHLDEVIIAFGGGHSHGGAWRGAGDPDHRFAASQDLVEGILGEEIVGCALEGGGGAIGLLSDLQRADCWSRVSAIRFWRGSLDR